MIQRFSIPLIKENRVDKLVEALKCIDSHPYDREKQRNCILKLYESKSEKSVFRGMIIPTLRYLGLIIGFGKAIRLSSNAKMILEGLKISQEEALRIRRAVFLEVDKSKFGFIEIIKTNSDITKKSLGMLIQPQLGRPNQKQMEERVKRWLNVLLDNELVGLKEGKYITLLRENHEQAEKELAIQEKRTLFKNILFEEYESAPLHETAGIIDIPLLRQLVALEFYRKHKMILTEAQFDALLQEIPLVTDDYVISLGQPMGAEEKLFHCKGNYYRTLSIRLFQRR